MTVAQTKALKALRGELRRLRKRFQVLRHRTRYEDLGHGVLALEIAEHAVNETLEQTGLGGEIRRSPDPAAHRQAPRRPTGRRGAGTRRSRMCEARPASSFERM